MYFFYGEENVYYKKFEFHHIQILKLFRNFLSLNAFFFRSLSGTCENSQRGIQIQLQILQCHFYQS